MNQKDQPCLYVVATPIGNLDDLSPRAKRTLDEADLIAAEDTRVAGKLLSLIGVTGKRVISYYDEVEQAKAPGIIDEMVEKSLHVALISDAGTPCISDPGFRLVAEAQRRGVRVVPIPGPSSLTTLVSAAGLANHRVLFVGFLPSKDGDLRREIESWRLAAATVCFLESLRRLRSSVTVIGSIYPGATVVVGRELTKMFEEIVRGTVTEIAQWLDNHESLKGEASIMVELGASGAEGAFDLGRIRTDAIKAFRGGSTLKELLQTYRDIGIGRKELYQLLLEAKDEADR